MKAHGLSFREVPFSRLIEESEELSKLRQEYANKSARERREAADYQYHSSIAESIISQISPLYDDDNSPWPGEVMALAIDPTYAPAILTVGSYEYIYGRKDEAMIHFMSLTKLPEDTEDLAVIIDKAGDFLIENEDIENATKLYFTATTQYPQIALFHNSLSYCYGILGELEKAVEEAKLAVELDPDNYLYLTDLGWSLVEAEKLDEAEIVLEKAVSLSPPDYELARNNLEELRRRKK